MTLTRALAVSLLLSCAAAGLVAVVSRAPASVRTPALDLSSPATEGFTDEQVARHGAYRGPLYLAFGLGLVAEVVMLVLLRGGPMDRLVTWASGLPGGWIGQAAIAGAALAGAAALVALPIGFVRGYAIQKAWSLSNQDAGGWLLDQVKGAGVAAVIAAVSAVAFFAIVRLMPRWWWLWGAGIFTALSAILVFVFPVAIAPLFNRFSPLDDPTLTRRVEALAAKAGVDVDRILVSDASKRSTAENAYVAGLGATKQIVLFDTLVEGPEGETLFVVAHELAHEQKRHLVKGIALSAAGLLAGFAMMAWLVSSGRLLRWARVDSLSDPRVIPVLLLFALVAGLLVRPIENAVSRSFEAEADRVAIEFTGDPGPAVRAFHRLALTNISDLRPVAPAVWLFYTHPPIADRIEAARATEVARP